MTRIWSWSSADPADAWQSPLLPDSTLTDFHPVSRVPDLCPSPVVLSHHAEAAASSWYIYISWYISWYIGWYQNYSTTEQALSEWIILINQLYSFSLQIRNTSGLTWVVLSSHCFITTFSFWSCHTSRTLQTKWMRKKEIFPILLPANNKNIIYNFYTYFHHLS